MHKQKLKMILIELLLNNLRQEQFLMLMVMELQMLADLDLYKEQLFEFKGNRMGYYMEMSNGNDYWSYVRHD